MRHVMQEKFPTRFYPEFGFLNRSIFALIDVSLLSYVRFGANNWDRLRCIGQRCKFFPCLIFCHHVTFLRRFEEHAQWLLSFQQLRCFLPRRLLIDLSLFQLSFTHVFNIFVFKAISQFTYLHLISRCIFFNLIRLYRFEWISFHFLIWVFWHKSIGQMFRFIWDFFIFLLFMFWSCLLFLWNIFHLCVFFFIFAHSFLFFGFFFFLFFLWVSLLFLFVFLFLSWFRFFSFFLWFLSFGSFLRFFIMLNWLFWRRNFFICNVKMLTRNI